MARHWRPPQAPSTHPVVDWLIAFAAMCVIACAVLLFFGIYSQTKAQDWPNCREFGFNIATSCCCTANCCSEARAGEFAHLGGKTYRVIATGQEVERTGWSPDGRTIKCACDLIGATYTKHPRAKVHCFFPPMPAM